MSDIPKLLVVKDMNSVSEEDRKEFDFIFLESEVKRPEPTKYYVRKNFKIKLLKEKENEKI